MRQRADKRLRVVALAIYPVEAPSTRFRVSQFTGALSEEGIDLTLLPSFGARVFESIYDSRRFVFNAFAVLFSSLRRLLQLPWIARADVVFVQRETSLVGPPWLPWLITRVLRVPMVLDLDDATYVEMPSPVYGRLATLLKWRGKADWLIDHSACVVCGNESIAAHVRGRGRRAVVLPTIADTAVFVPRERREGNEKPVIGWIGTHSTWPYVEEILPVLDRLAAEHDFRFRVVGSGRTTASTGRLEAELAPWRLDREVADFQSLDIGLYPMPADEWAKGKSGLKAVEYLAAGVPFVASPVGIVAQIGEPARTHLLASSPDEWYEALGRLLRDPELRRAMGKAGRAYAVANYSTTEWARRLAGVFRDVADGMPRNVDLDVVNGFGDEWRRFDQSALSEAERRQLFESYFDIFPWSELPSGAVGFDAGCGAGRWASFVAPRVGRLHCFDASRAAVEVARHTLQGMPNCNVQVATVDAMPIPDGGADFGYSLGVLHHIPDTAAALRDCVAKLRPGAPFLLYLYYQLETRPFWYRLLWRTSEPFRLVISRAPHALRYAASQILAATVYWPLARIARAAERAGWNAESWPLAFYRNRSYYVMRNDALDRFGTRLERRFTRAEIESMMRQAGLTDIVFSPHAPFWCAVGRRQRA